MMLEEVRRQVGELDVAKLKYKVSLEEGYGNIFLLETVSKVIFGGNCCLENN